MRSQRGWLWSAMAVGAVALFFSIPSVEATDWTALGPEGGEVLTFAVGPQPDFTIFAGTSSGVYRSDDGGSSWKFCGLAKKRVLSLAVDPTMPMNVYAGLDNDRPYTYGGVFSSTDGGDTWVDVSNGLDYPEFKTPFPENVLFYYPVRSLYVDPLDPNILFAGTGDDGGLFMSTDRGANWSWKHFRDDVEVLATDPAKTGTIFAALGDGGIFRSHDSGETWEFAGEGLPSYGQGFPPAFPPTIIGISIVSSETDTLYATTVADVFKSTDGGDSWLNLGRLPSTVMEYASVVGISADTENPDSAWVATELDGVFHTEDGGASWNDAGTGLECGPDNAGVSRVRLASLATDTSTGEILAGAQREGVFVLSAASNIWTQSNRGLFATDVSSVAVNPGNSREILAATSGLGVLSSSDGGENWIPFNTGIGDECGPSDHYPWTGPVPDCRVFDAILWPSSNGPILAAGECGVFRRPNDSASWDLSRSPGPWAGDLASTPQDRLRVYASRDGRYVEHSANGGLTWSSFVKAPYGTRVHIITVSPEDDSTVFVGTNRGLYLTRNGGTTWEGPAAGINLGCPDFGERNVRAIAFEPNRPEFLYAGTSCGVFVSEDEGTSWEKAGLEDNEVTALAFGRDEIFAGTRQNGIWHSIDGGVSWATLGDNDGISYVNDLVVDSSKQQLYVSTAGNGVYSWEIPQPPPRTPSGRVGNSGDQKRDLSLNKR